MRGLPARELKPCLHAGALLARTRSLKRLVDRLRERGGCFVVDRYVFGLSTKHPLVSVRELKVRRFSSRSRV